MFFKSTLLILHKNDVDLYFLGTFKVDFLSGEMQNSKQKICFQTRLNVVFTFENF